MNPRILPLLLAAASLLFAGCVPESINPLSTPETSVIDPHLEGAFEAIAKRRDKDVTHVYWHFHYRIAGDSPKDKQEATNSLEIVRDTHLDTGQVFTVRYKALATHIRGGSFLSYWDERTLATDKGPVRCFFARYEVSNDGILSVWLANGAAFAAAIKAGQLHGKVTGPEGAVTAYLTDTTEQLLAFLATGDMEKLFGGLEEFIGDQPLVFHCLAH